MMMNKILRKTFNRFGYDIVPAPSHAGFEPEFVELAARCQPYTMTPMERLYGLYKATEYVARAKVPGDIVECGVWRGGSCMMSALTLRRERDVSRNLFLYDTYAGMTQPGEFDVDFKSESAMTTWKKSQQSDKNVWCYASLEDVKSNMESTGYPSERVHLVKGDVLQTIPATAPAAIALLRLDTDFYESTKHALAHLFPRLAPKGVLIIDDYGHWRGAKKAVDEYFAQSGVTMLLNRLDYTARIGVKT